jgi:hypothetical protein
MNLSAVFWLSAFISLTLDPARRPRKIMKLLVLRAKWVWKVNRGERKGTSLYSSLFKQFHCTELRTVGCLGTP